MANLKVLDDLAIKNSSGLPTQGMSVLPQVGFVMLYAGTTAPSGWFICNGGTFSSTTYPLLYAALGNTTTLPDLKGRYLVGTTNSSLIKTSIGQEYHDHVIDYQSTIDNASAEAHETAGAASNWSNLGLSHQHTGNYWFDVPGSPRDHRGAGYASNSYSNVPVNTTAGNQANVWNSTHGHGQGGGIGYNAATVNHSHAGNFSTTTISSNQHSHTASATSGTTSPTSHKPSTVYLNYIIKAG
jgi:microcystin-dependent protein